MQQIGSKKQKGTQSPNIILVLKNNLNKALTKRSK